MSSTSRPGVRRSQAPTSLSVSGSNTRLSSSTLAPGPYVAALSVEDWEAKAPLGELEIRSVNAIKNASEKIPYPLKFTKEDGDDDDEGGANGGDDSASSRSPTPINVRFASSRPSTPSMSSPLHRSTPSASRVSALHPRQPVNTTQQLYDWFALIDRSVAHSQESHFRQHVASVSEYLDMCDMLLARVDEIEGEVETMTECWWSVEEGGRSLKDACERVLEERDKLIELTTSLSSHLDYFTSLEHATRMLNHPGDDLLFSPSFLSVVSQIDSSISFLRARRHYKESEVYLLRFHQCLTRAMTLVKMNFVGSLRALSSDTLKRLGDSTATLSETAVMHLLYTRFGTVAGKVRPLVGELERRARTYPEDLGSLLAECHAAYFGVRKALLVPKVLEEIRGLDPAGSELVELTRTGCSYLKQLCTDEFNLYRKFFSTAEDQLYQYLESLCDLLYDDLRPRILHEARLTALCEVCTVLQALMVLDAPASSGSGSSVLFSTHDAPLSSSHLLDPDSDSDSSSPRNKLDDKDDDDTSSFDDELNIDFTHAPLHFKRRGHTKSDGVGFVRKRLHTQRLLQMVLQDAQTRLFFKAQAVVQGEVRWFRPGKEDVAWPDVILNSNKPRGPMEIREKESVSRIFDKDANASDGLGEIMRKQETWYPTVRKMVWVLEQLHDFVKPAIFEDIAQEATALCRQSLFSAADLIKARPPPSTPLDGSLFLVRHLLIVKEVARRVGLVVGDSAAAGQGVGSGSGMGMGSGQGMGKGGGSSQGVGGPLSPGGVAGTLTTMLNRTTAILPEGLFASLGVPRADENMLDVKHGLDDDLRRACEEVISSCVNPLCEPLDEWVMRVRTYSHSQQQTLGAHPNSQVGTGAAAATPLPISTGAAGGAAGTTPAKVKELYEAFRLKTERDLRANAARIKLYLGDQPVQNTDDGGAVGGAGEGSSTPRSAHPSNGGGGGNGNGNGNGGGGGGGGRTARVLIEHVRERVWEGYRGFLESVKEVALKAAVGAREGDGEREREWREVVRGMEGEGEMREVLRGVCGL